MSSEQQTRDPYQGFLELVETVESGASEERVEELEQRLGTLENYVSKVDQYRRESLEDLAAAVEGLHNRLEELEAGEEVELVPRDSVSDSEEQVEEDEDESVSDGSPQESEMEDEDDVLECPQCGESDFDSVESFAAHTTFSDDHTNIAQFFRSPGDKDFECPICNREISSREYLGVHLAQEHETNMSTVYVDRFDELKKRGRVDGPYNFEGNVPDLHDPKYIREYSPDEVQYIVEKFLSRVDEELTLNQIAERKFDQEFVTGSSEYQKLLSAVNDSPLIESRTNPYNGTQNLYFVEDAENGGDGQ